MAVAASAILIGLRNIRISSLAARLGVNVDK